MTHDEQIAALIEAGEKATQGEWHKVGLPWNNASPYIIAGHHDPHVGKAIIDVIEQDGYSGDDDEDIERQIAQDEYEMQTNCDFIAQAANSREAIRAMHTELLALREVAAEMAKALNSCLKELWDDRHSGMSEEQFDAYFEDEKQALTKYNAMKG